MKHVDSPKCLVCGSLDTELFLECTDHFVTKQVFHINRCRHCGFRFTADAPGSDKIGPFYKSEAYISHSNTKKGLINRLYHLVRNIMMGRKYRLIKQLSDHKRLLDIGCGTGHFLHFMKQQGYQCAGIEMDEAARMYAQKTFGLDVSDTSVLYKTAPVETYDIITLWHVLEHLHDADHYLEWIREALTKQGTLVIALPNCASYDAAYYKAYWAAYDVPRHLWHFEPATFKSYIARLGFEVTSVKRLPFDAYYNSLMSARYAKKPVALIHGFILGLLSTINSLFSAEKTSSVIYTLRKK